MATTRAARVVGVLAVAVAIGGCDDVQQHVYSGYLFDPVNDCVSGTSTAIDVVPGAATGNTCAPVCLVDGAGNVYVSPVCGPYPSGTTAEGADAGDPCTAALAAYDQADGGGICGNGGAADAGVDATEAGGAAGDAAGTVDAADAGEAGRSDAARD